MTRGRIALIVGSIAAAVLLTLVVNVPTARAVVIERVSVASDGTQANYDSHSPVISSDGRYVAFGSSATNLVPGDTNYQADIFVHDRQTGETTLVSVSSSGMQGDAGSYTPSISADGRYIAFTSGATNLVDDDTNDTLDVFVRDRQEGTTVRVSVNNSGAEAVAPWGSGSPSISADGRYVAFVSEAANLVPDDTNGVKDIFVHDLDSGVTVRASVATDGTQGDADSYAPSVSLDGHHVAFESLASNLVPADTNSWGDVFVRDLQARTTARVSVTSDGIQGDCGSGWPSISADGRCVAFSSMATNLVAGDTDGAMDVFVHDLQTGNTELIDPGGSENAHVSWSGAPSISADGRYLAFSSGGNVPGGRCVVICDRQTGYRRWVTGQSSMGSQAITADGRCVPVQAWADYLVPGNEHQAFGIFVIVDATGPATYDSLRGVDRYDTAIRLSKARFPDPLPAGSGLVLAPGETFQEALCGGPLAAAYGGPVLLTTKTGLDNRVKAEILRLQPAYVICIGLSDTIRSAVQGTLGTTGTASVIRGTNVYEMSYKVAKALGARLAGMYAAVGLITRGDVFPDAIGVSPLACVWKWPILLTGPGTTLSMYATQAMAELAIDRALKIGTYATLPDWVEGIGNLSGVDRYETNRNVAKWARDYGYLSFTHLALATGDKFPDALAAGPFLAKDRGTLLLSPLYGPLPGVIADEIDAFSLAVWHVSFIACIEPVIGQVKALLP